MSSFFDDDEINDADPFPDYVLKNKRIRNDGGVSTCNHRFNLENASIVYNNGDEEDIGVSKKSYEITKEDHLFIDRQDYVNLGRVHHNDDECDDLIERIFGVDDFIDYDEDE